MHKLPVTGDKDLDTQHSQLIEWMNKLKQSIQNHETQEVVGRLIQRLQFYAYTHFAFEEGGMAFFGYPERMAHIEEHHFFSAWLKDLKEIIERDPSFAAQSVLDFLQMWLIKHIGNSDTHYAKFVAEKKL